MGVAVQDDHIELEEISMQQSDALSEAEQPTNTRVCKLTVDGMTCSSCVSKIERHLTKKAGISDVSVSLVMMGADIKYDPEALHGASQDAKLSTPELLAKWVSDLGFDAQVSEDGAVDAADSADDVGLAKTQIELSRAHDAADQKVPDDFVDALVEMFESLPGVETAAFVASASRSDGDEAETFVFSLKYQVAVTGNRHFLTAVLHSTLCSGWRGSVRPIRQDAADQRKERQLAEINAYKRAFLIGLPFAIIVMVLMLAVFRYVEWFEEPVSDTFPVPPKVLFVWILCSPVQFYCGLCFFRVAVKELRYCSLGMSTLVVTGSLISYAVSFVAMIMVAAGALNPATQLTDFFETSASLVTFILLGKWLEARAKAFTGRALEKLMALQAKTALLFIDADEGSINQLAGVHHSDNDVSSDAGEPKSEQHSAEDVAASAPVGTVSVAGDAPSVDFSNGEWVEVECFLLHVGDTVKVLPGSVVPIDGEIIAGTGSVDESMLTGESVPVRKAVGDTVFGATLNLDGALYVRVTSAGDQSMLNQIVSLVENAQAAKAPIQALSDKISSIFVPIILAISVGAFIIWSAILPTVLGNSHEFNEDGTCNFTYDFNGTLGVTPSSLAESNCWRPHGVSDFGLSATFGIAALVVACPCALGLAVPTTVMVATGLAARLGILIKGGDVLQGSTNVSAVLFDKTGTLTLGKPGVTSEAHIDVAGLRRIANEQRQSATPADGKSNSTETSSSLSSKGVIVLDVEGMRCMKNCGTPVQNVLRSANLEAMELQVAEANVDFPARQAIVRLEYADQTRNIADISDDLRRRAGQALVEEVEDIGFESRVAQVETGSSTSQTFTVVIDVRGMRCMKNCGTPVQNVLREADLSAIGLVVQEAHVDFPARQAIVTMSPVNGKEVGEQTRARAIDMLVSEVEDIGFEAEANLAADGTEAASETVQHGSELEVVLEVKGMRCMKNCGTPVVNVLKDADVSQLGYAVRDVNMDFPARRVTVTLAPRADATQFGSRDKVIDLLAEEVDNIGYEATQHEPTVTQGVEPDARLKNLWLLGCAELGSDHPLAVGLTDFAKLHLPDNNPKWLLREPDELQVLPGQGVKALVGKSMLLVGNRHVIPEEPPSSSLNPASGDVLANRKARELMHQFESKGETAIVLVVDGVAQAVFGLADEVRPESAATVAALHRAKYQVFMITGDNRTTAAMIAKQLQIPVQRVLAEVLPQHKADQVKSLQGMGMKVAMVGDGINDAPALAQADLGIAVGSGTEIAAETANMVLLNSNPEDVVLALDICRHAYGRIRLNLFMSLLYNCIGVPFGAGVFYAATRPMTLPPAIAAIAMALSSVSVVLSALALNVYKRRDADHIVMPRVNRNSCGQQLRKFCNDFCRRRLAAQPVVFADETADVECAGQLEQPAVEAGQTAVPFCRMDDTGNAHDCDCPASSCTCRTCTTHDVLTNIAARTKALKAKRANSATLSDS